MWHFIWWYHIFFVKSSIDDNYVDNGNWQTEAFNRGVQSGANQIVEKYERECLEDSPDECNDLGVAAAQGEANMLYWSCNIVNLQSSYY